MNLVFYGKNIDECLDQAAKELKLPKEELQYKIIKKSGFFSRNVEIKIINKEDNLNDIDNLLTLINDKESNDNSPSSDNDAEIDLNNTFEDFSLKSETSSSGIQVVNGNILIRSNSDEQFTITACTGINLSINGIYVPSDTTHTVTKDDIIEYTPVTHEPHKNLKIRVSDDKMKVFAKTEYFPEYTYHLNDSELSKNLKLKARKIPGKQPEKYAESDILNELSRLKIRQGIKHEVLQEVCEGTIGAEILIAEGIPQKDDKEDEIKILFADKDEREAADDDISKTIDYRNLINIANVKKGEVLAVKIPGIAGTNGIDVFGTIVPKKTLRSKTFKAQNGCTLEDNHIIATKSGRPSEQNGIFTVNDLYSVNDVDLTTGNINFIGDVEVSNNINDGMSVHAKGSLLVRKNITSAKASANGPINILGSVINSNILAGGYDVEKKTYAENLTNFRNLLVKLIQNIETIISQDASQSIGEIMRILIEKRYKNIPTLSMNILSFNISSGIQKSTILDFIRNKLMGLNTFNIKSINELIDFKEEIEAEIEIVSDQLEIPIDVSISYSQNSKIVATGNIYVTGKGQYTSTLKAFDTIEFTDPGSVARGGEIQAGNAIILKTVGSVAGVITTLTVEKSGIITADVAYNNTVFCFGDKKKMLEVSGRNIKAYIDQDGDIAIDKFVLD